MAKQTVKDKKEESNQDRKDKKQTMTAFLLMFPSFIIALIAILASSSWLLSAISIALLFYQFAMTQQFIKDYWNSRIN